MKNGESHVGSHDSDTGKQSVIVKSMKYKTDLVKFDAEFSSTFQWGGEWVQILAPKRKEFLNS